MKFVQENPYPEVTAEVVPGDDRYGLCWLTRTEADRLHNSCNWGARKLPVASTRLRCMAVILPPKFISVLMALIARKR